MRSFGLVIIVLGVMIVYLGWQGKVIPAFNAVFGTSLGSGGTSSTMPSPAQAGYGTSGTSGGNFHTDPGTPAHLGH